MCVYIYRERERYARVCMPVHIFTCLRAHRVTGACILLAALASKAYEFACVCMRATRNTYVT